MVPGHGFESWLHLKTRWKDGPLDGRKIPKKIKTAKWGKSHQKNILKKQQCIYCFFQINYKSSPDLSNFARISPESSSNKMKRSMKTVSKLPPNRNDEPWKTQETIWKISILLFFCLVCFLNFFKAIKIVTFNGFYTSVMLFAQIYWTLKDWFLNLPTGFTIRVA